MNANGKRQPSVRESSLIVQVNEKPNTIYMEVGSTIKPIKLAESSRLTGVQKSEPRER
jgi:hypothetical protein